MTSAQRRRTHFYLFFCTWIHKHFGGGRRTRGGGGGRKKKRQTFVLSRMHMCCGARLGKNKAGCLLFAGCGNRFASMPSLSHEGLERGIQKKRDRGREWDRGLCGGKICCQRRSGRGRELAAHACRCSCWTSCCLCAWVCMCVACCYTERQKPN